MRDSSRSLLQRPEVSPSIVPAAFFNENEYTLFFRLGTGEILVRVTVSGEKSAIEADRDVIAYQVMDLIVDCGSLITHCG
jgi:Mg2+ and Co2+ transporter CorA